MREEAEFSKQDLHALLGVPRGATANQIRFAYRLHARKSHPDLNPDDPDAGRRMAELNRAVRILLDPVLRGAYERAQRVDGAARSSTERSSRWYESAQATDDEWGSPSPAAAVATTPGQRAFRRRVRHAGADVAARAQEAMRRVGNEQRLVLAALCIALGSALLVFARPSNAFWSSGEASASAAPLSP